MKESLPAINFRKSVATLTVDEETISSIATNHITAQKNQLSELALKYLLIKL